MTGYSIEAQNTSIDRMCATSGLDIVARFEEYHSAKDEGRPEFDRMVQYLLANPGVRAVVVDKTDRLSRNLIDMGVIRDRLGCRVMSVKDPAENTPNGHFQQDIALAYASMYSKNLAVEVRKGMRAKFEAGGIVSKVPPGYRNVSRTRTEKARVELDLKRAPIVHRAFELYSEGTWSLSDIALAAASDGLTSSHGKPFSIERVAQMLKNRTYLGMTTYRGELRPGLHPAIIEAELFEKVQQVIKRRHRDSGEKGHRRYTLRGLIRCRACKRQMTAETHEAKGRSYYRCQGRSGVTYCPMPYVRVEVLEEEVLSLLQAVELPLVEATAIIEDLEMRIDDDRRQLATRREDTARERVDLHKKLVRLTDVFTSGDLDRGTYVDLKDEIMRKLALAEARLKERGNEQTISELRDHVSAATKIISRYEAANDPDTRKRVLAKYIRVITVENRQVVDIEFHAPFHLLLSTQRYEREELRRALLWGPDVAEEPRERPV